MYGSKIAVTDEETGEFLYWDYGDWHDAFVLDVNNPTHTYLYYLDTFHILSSVVWPKLELNFENAVESITITLNDDVYVAENQSTVYYAPDYSPYMYGSATSSVITINVNNQIEYAIDLNISAGGGEGYRDHTGGAT